MGPFKCRPGPEIAAIGVERVGRAIALCFAARQSNAKQPEVQRAKCALNPRYVEHFLVPVQKKVVDTTQMEEIR